jgi:protein required for attachment to host cells
MARFKLEEGCWVLIGDGRKALFLVNEGDEKFPNLRRLSVRLHETPATHDMGTDAPGRSFASVGARRSALQTTDWHDLEEHRFAATIAAEINAAARDNRFKRLLIVAPPKILADLRQELSPMARGKLVGEMDKDLTKHSIAEIERLLTAH